MSTPDDPVKEKVKPPLSETFQKAQEKVASLFMSPPSPPSPPSPQAGGRTPPQETQHPHLLVSPCSTAASSDVFPVSCRELVRRLEQKSQQEKMASRAVLKSEGYVDVPIGRIEDLAHQKPSGTQTAVPGYQKPSVGTTAVPGYQKPNVGTPAVPGYQKPNVGTTAVPGYQKTKVVSLLMPSGLHSGGVPAIKPDSLKTPSIIHMVSKEGLQPKTTFVQVFIPFFVLTLVVRELDLCGNRNNCHSPCWPIA